MDRIDAKQKEINEKLDVVIAALHAYDDANIEDINEGYGESSFEAFMDDEEAANKRMDIIGQNGNEGSHYVTNEEADEDAFNDYGMRVDKDKSNKPANIRGNKNNVKRNKGKKSAVVEHIKYPPHKH